MHSKNDWYACKPYLHFDQALDRENAERLVTSPERVSKHPFYPFLAYDLIIPRVQVDKDPPRSIRPTPKVRAIAYPSHRDGYIFSYYKSILQSPYEDWVYANGLEDVITAFRPIGKNNIRLAKEAFDYIRDNPDFNVIVTDINSFFDHLDHDLLKKQWGRFLGNSLLPNDHYAVFRAITRYSIVKRYKAYNALRIALHSHKSKGRRLRRLCNPQQFKERIVARGLLSPNPGLANRQGVPQGSPLSPLLSNIYMADFDLSVRDNVSLQGGKYWRYCDDILIVTSEKPESVIENLDAEFAKVSLSRNIGKTHYFLPRQISKTHLLQYLGFMYDGEKISVRASTIQRYYRKVGSALWVAHFRQQRESKASGQKAPFRRRALYNMYSNLSLRGNKIHDKLDRHPYKGNFIHYLSRSAKALGEPAILKQRKKVLLRFRNKMRKHM